jgi:hypothetical protein
VSATVPMGLDIEALELTLEPIDEFAQPELPDRIVIALDQRDEFPEGLVRRMCGEGRGVRLSDGADAQQTAAPRREAAASPSAAAPAPATVGRDALAPIRAAMGS